jgi:hypothetical protein
MKKLFTLLTGLFFAVIPASLFSGTIHVPSDYTTIQDAIDAGSDSDTILIADGTYSGNGNINIELNEREIVIKSVNGPESCKIDGSGTGNAVCFLVPDSFSIFRNLSVIDGFTIQNFKIGFYLMGSKTACVIKNNIIKNCNSAIFSANGAHPLFKNNEITDNINYDWEFGIIYLRGSYTTLEGNFIHDNRNVYANVGIICCEWSDSSRIERNTINNNTGCIILVNLHAKGVKITGNKIIGNINDTPPMNITYDRYNSPSKETLSLAFDRSISIVNESTVSIKNNLIFGNAGNIIGGIFCDNSSYAEIINNDLIDNSSGITVKNPNANIMNNIILNSGSPTQFPGLQQWAYDTLIMQVYYEGAKRKAVKYFYGFKNNGETDNVSIKGCGLNTTFLVQSGECCLLETTSFVDDFANGGGIYLTIQLGTDTLKYSNNIFGNEGNCIYLYDTEIHSYGLNNPGMIGSGTGIIGIADNPFTNIAYNDIYHNLGGNYILNQPVNDTDLTEINLPDGDANISKDPLQGNDFSLSVGSPCIDAGNPEELYNDAALPPGLGSVRNDMGVYGGPMNADIEYKPLNVIKHGFRGDIALFPNPTSGMLFINTGDEFRILTIEVYNFSGQMVEKRTIKKDTHIEINLGGPSGLYLISLQSDTGERESFTVCKK